MLQTQQFQKHEANNNDLIVLCASIFNRGIVSYSHPVSLSLSASKAAKRPSLMQRYEMSRNSFSGDMKHVFRDSRSAV